MINRSVALLCRAALLKPRNKDLDAEVCLESVIYELHPTRMYACLYIYIYIYIYTHTHVRISDITSRVNFINKVAR